MIKFTEEDPTGTAPFCCLASENFNFSCLYKKVLKAIEPQYLSHFGQTGLIYGLDHPTQLLAHLLGLQYSNSQATLLL